MSLLGLPAEVRLMIYHQLFADVTVTIRRARQEPTEGPWNILRTCQLCYREGLPVFYDCVTFKLQHELFLHVLSQKIGAQNLARVKSLAVGGYRDEVGTALVARLPTALQKFRIIYETGPDWEKDTPEGQLEDRHLQGALKLRKHWMKSCVKQMWSQKPPVRIFVETFVGLAPKYGDTLEERQKARYLYISVELLGQNQDQEKWSWGPITRIIDQSMMKSPNRERVW